MANKTTVKVTYSPTNPTKPNHDAPTNPKQTKLNKGDTITIKLNKFLRNSTIDKIDIYNSIVIKGKHRKNKSSLLGSWTRSRGNGTGLKGFFLCFVDYKKSRVVIVNTEDNTINNDHHYWYSVSGTDGRTNKTWSIDPEVINTGR